MAVQDVMDLFRSEEMQLVQLIIPAESAHDTITYLGQLGLLQFKDVSILLRGLLKYVSVTITLSLSQQGMIYFAAPCSRLVIFS